MKKVIVVGGGISGLVASYVFNQFYDIEVTVFEPNKLGGEFSSGGLKYLHKSNLIRSMLGELGLAYSNFTIKGGIHLQGEVKDYRKHMQKVGRKAFERIQHDHYVKTRKMEPSEFSTKCMNDPFSGNTKKGMRCDLNALIEELGKRANINNSAIATFSLDAGIAINTNAVTFDFDYLVFTIPLWIIKKIGHFEHFPDSTAMALHLINVKPVGNPYVRWDYVYTPYTPGNSIHRLSYVDGFYSCEVSGEMNESGVYSDLNFLFPNGFEILEWKRNMKGHLLPLAEPPQWPERVAPLGRFASWNPRATVDVVMEQAYDLAKHWGWRKKGVGDGK